MSIPSSSVPASSEDARSESIGYLALIQLGERLPLQVLHSTAGYYIGTTDEGGPASRESVQYFPSYQAASSALTTGRWQQRLP